MKSVVAFGNPLLDVTVSPKDRVLALLQKYNLKLDCQKEISRSEMNLLTKDIESLEQSISPGGCCQNSLRVLQWVLNMRGNTTIFGSVGRDHEADILRKALESEGVKARYITQDLPTGKTIALIHGSTRTLVAHIGAAEVLPLQALLDHPDFTPLFEAGDIIFIEAYFLTNRFEAAKHLVSLCQSQEKLLVYNLCGEYIFKVVPEPIKHLVNHSNVIFGNKAEYLALKELLNFGSLEEMLLHLVKREVNSLNKYGRILVITDGPLPLQCYSENEIIKILPPVINEHDIKDTTGAGDAFVGGFLAGLSMSKDLTECIHIGFYAASQIIKQSGCSLPEFESQWIF